jgi:hypothetical protein
MRLFWHGVVGLGLASSACMQKGGLGSGSQDGSNLSEISVNIPTKDKYPAVFGQNCANVNLSNETKDRLGVQDNCEAVAKLLDGFLLSVKSGKCDDSVNATDMSKSGTVSQTKIQESLNKGCKYSVALELGEISTRQIYYSNRPADIDNLDLPKTAADQVQLKVVLNVTDVGARIGFPKTITIVSTQANVGIDAQFGGAASPAPNASSSPNIVVAPSGTPTVAPKFADVNTRVFEKRCVPCHGSAGPAARLKFVGVESAVKTAKTQINERIADNAPANKVMPPTTPGLTAEEKDLIRRLLATYP